MKVVLVPDALANSEPIVRSVDDVVNGDDEGQKPSDDGQDSVGGDGDGAVGFPLGERVDCATRARLVDAHAK